jgi:hypothetical protein
MGSMRRYSVVLPGPLAVLLNPPLTAAAAVRLSARGPVQSGLQGNIVSVRCRTENTFPLLQAA